MSALTDNELTILEALEFVPPCEHSSHERNGTSEPAFWAVRFVPVLECGCPPITPLALWCKPCMNRLSLGSPTCNTCAERVSVSHCVLSVEEL